MCRSFDVWTIPYAQRERLMAAITVVWCPCRQVNSRCHGLALLLLCAQRRGYLWRRRWKRHPSISYRIDRTIPLPLLCHPLAPEVLPPLCVGPPPCSLERGWRGRDKHWVIPPEKLIFGGWGWWRVSAMEKDKENLWSRKSGSLFCRWSLRRVQLRWVCAFTSNYFKVCPEDAIVRLYWICNTYCDSIWCYCRPKLQFWDPAACSCSVKQRKSHWKKKGRGVNMLLSKIQNIDYMTSLISGLFGQLEEIWKSIFPRAFLSEDWGKQGGGHSHCRHTSRLHISCPGGALASEGPELMVALALVMSGLWHPCWFLRVDLQEHQATVQSHMFINMSLAKETEEKHSAS